MSKKPKRFSESNGALNTLNFWLITLGVVIAGFMAGQCLIWMRGGL